MHEPGPYEPAPRAFRASARGKSEGAVRAHLDDEHDGATLARGIGEAGAEEGGQAAGGGLV